LLFLEFVRRQRHRTLFQLQRQTGINGATISLIESGQETAPSDRVLKALAKALKVSPPTDLLRSVVRAELAPVAESVQPAPQ
jgi:transcriptional regulator with XRE-family HTH domain